MKTILDSLMLEVSLRPDLGRLLSALLISSGIIIISSSSINISIHISLFIGGGSGASRIILAES